MAASGINTKNAVKDECLVRTRCCWQPQLARNWSEVSKVAREIEEIRDQFNRFIGPLLEQLRQIASTP